MGNKSENILLFIFFNFSVFQLASYSGTSEEEKYIIAVKRLGSGSINFTGPILMREKRYIDAINI